MMGILMSAIIPSFSDYVAGNVAALLLRRQ